MRSLPKVLLVGGPDVDARLGFMHCIKDTLDISALGSRSALYDRLYSSPAYLGRFQPCL